MRYVYAAIFDANSDGSYTITFPDLPGCISEGKNLYDALYMADVALREWLEYLSGEGQSIPEASDLSNIKSGDGQFINLVHAEVPVLA